MQPLFVLAGAVVVLGILADFLLVTLSVAKVRGSLSAAVTRASRGAFARGPRSVRSAGGPITVLLVIASWFVVATVGWALVTEGLGAGAGVADGLRRSAEGLVTSPPDPVEAAVSPTVVEWVATLQHLYGVALVSLALAWLLPVVSAVVQRRSFAVRVAALGLGPDDLTEEEVGDTDLHLHVLDLATDLVEIAERHRAYPVLHAFQTGEPQTSLAVGLARLNDLEHRLRDFGHHPHTLRVLRHALDHATQVFAEGFQLQANPEEARSDDEREGGDSDETEDVHAADERRGWVLDALVEHEGWGDVVRQESSTSASTLAR